MKTRILFLLMLCLCTLDVAAQKQKYTFSVHDDLNANYRVVIDMSSSTLSMTKNGSQLFSKRFYNPKYANGMIGFAFEQGSQPLMRYSQTERFFLISLEAVMYNKMTSDGRPFYGDPDVPSSFQQEFQSLRSALTGSVNEPFQGNIQTFTVNGVSFNMVKVEGGTFTMGATSEQGNDAWDEEKPAHQVTLSSYMIGETEVTQELWQAVMGSNPSNFKGNLQRPVEQVSWNDCQQFILKLNNLTGKQFRLPTEAEWEYAARSGAKSRGYRYAGSNKIVDVAWYDVNSYNKGSGSPDYGTHVVKTKSPNELGLYDMSGNVWEWCQDWYGSYSSNSQSNSKGPTSGSGRVVRGGSWGSDTGRCRVSFRGSFDPVCRYSHLGFRLAL